MSDLRHAFRVLKSSPLFTVAALAVLALGIGANGAIVALTDAVLLKPLPVVAPDRLVVLGTVEGGDPETNYGFSYPGFKDLRDGVRDFAGVFASSGMSASVTYNGQSERCYAEVVTGGYFETLGVRPYLGRLLGPQDDDDAFGAHPVVVLDYAFWQHLGADPALVGRDLLVNGKGLTVVGVSARGFYGTDISTRPQLRVPMSMAPVLRPNPGDPTLSRRGHQWLRVMARLAPGVSIEQATTSARVAFAGSIRARLAEMPASTPAAARRRVERLQLELGAGAQGSARMQRSAARPLLLLGGATLTLLLITCANLANLLLARNASRAREFAVRAALGAGRWQLARQLVVESLLLSTAGGALGVLVSFWMAGVVLRFLPRGNALGTELVPDARVIGATFGIALATGLLFGLAPALRSARQGAGATLKADAPTLASSDRLVSVRSLLIAAQVAMSFVLLLGAGLFQRTLQNLNGVDTGFSRDRVLVATLDPSLNGYDGVRTAALLSEFLQRVQAIPGVEHAGLSSVSPITGSWDVNSLRIAGYQTKTGDEPDAHFAAVSPGYLEAMGIVPRQGRTFTWRDAAGAPAVAVVNETMAREYFDGAAVGRRFSLDDGKSEVEVVGVVPDEKYVNLREARAPRFAYVSFLQLPISGGELTLHAKTQGDPLRYADAVKGRLRALDPTLPLAGVTTLEEQIAESLSSERVLAALGSAFGVLALLLAAVGIYGVFAFAVARRTREIGLRMALGARPGGLALGILRQCAALVGGGIVGGLAAAWAMQGLLRSVLFGVAAADGLVTGGAIALVTAVAMAAAWVPARRAARLDPLTALRHE
jgi:predicted permease